MKQLIQRINTGETIVADVPVPKVGAGKVLIGVAASLVSAGTERMVVAFAEKNMLQKARSRPDLVRQTVAKAQREGVLTTLDAVRNRMDQPMGLGYSCAGIVIDVGTGVPEIQIGDRLACAGGGYAVHAEVVSVPRNLVVKLPDEVGYEPASFATLGAIALQGIRLSEAKLGEIIAVIGLGLLGQLTVQMLKAAGCIVLGMDLQSQRADLALTFGADAAVTSNEELIALSQQYSAGHGVDAVLITADTKSNDPVEVAGEVARNKGIVVAVGAVGTAIPRKPYYEKELDFRISRSYGPGRYDAEYEEKGHDYPYGYVRWTQQRNMQAFLQLVAEGKVDVRSMITHRFPIDDAPYAYDLITGKTGEPFLGVVVTYPGDADLSQKIRLRNTSQLLPEATRPQTVDRLRLGIIGAGNFANATLLPTLKNIANVELVGVNSSTGLSARSTGDRFKFAYCTTNTADILSDAAINTVAVLTRHNQHAHQVIDALEAGKHVFVEKPLSLNEDELTAVVQAYRAAARQDSAARSGQPMLMVGFNRRFAPFVQELKRHLRRVQEPLMLQYRVNAGYIPPEHWTQDPLQGGGRLIGEGCHFVDLLIYLAGSAPERVTTRALPDIGRYTRDNFQITLEFANGSIGTVIYVANGDKGFGKEHLEVFGGGLAASIDDYRALRINHGSTHVKQTARLRQDKGHRSEWDAIVAHLTAMAPVPISLDGIVRSMRATFAAQRSLEIGEPITLVEQA